MRDWSELPRDAIEAISKRLDNGADYVRFRSVCASWRSAAPRRPRLPWLLLHSGGRGGDMGLYEFPNPKPFKPGLPEGLLAGNHICGCSRGWVALVEGDPRIYDYPPGVSLRNPFTGALVRLPDFPVLPADPDSVESEPDDAGCHCFRAYSVTRFILSSDPVAAPHDCVAMAIFSTSRLVFCRLRGDAWTLYPYFSSNIEDIIFYKGRFYAVDGKRLFLCDTGPGAEVREITPPRVFKFTERSSSLVEPLTGDLFLVRTLETGYHSEPVVCKVYRVDLTSMPVKLVKLNDLGKENCMYIIEHHKINLLKLKQINVLGMEFGNVSLVTEVSYDTPSGCASVYWLTPSLGYGDYGASTSAGK